MSLACLISLRKAGLFSDERAQDTNRRRSNIISLFLHEIMLTDTTISAIDSCLVENILPKFSSDARYPYANT